MLDRPPLDLFQWNYDLALHANSYVALACTELGSAARRLCTMEALKPLVGDILSWTEIIPSAKSCFHRVKLGGDELAAVVQY